MAMISPLLPAPISTCLREDWSSISGARLGHGDCYRRSSGGLHVQDVYVRRRTSSGWLGGPGVRQPFRSASRWRQHEWRTRDSRHGGQYERRTSKRPERLREGRWCLYAKLLFGRLEQPQPQRVFLRIEHNDLLSSAQLFALRNRRGDVRGDGRHLPWRNV